LLLLWLLSGVIIPSLFFSLVFNFGDTKQGRGNTIFCCPFDVIEANGTFSKTIYIRERLGIISVSIILRHILHAVTKSEISFWLLLCQKVSKILYGIGGENSESSLSQFFPFS